MVKIRYAELPVGLHVATEAGDRCTIVFLKPGLTRVQRKDALTVARRSARFGHGPSLPTLDMAFALAADRTRTTARITTSALRHHPLLLLPVLVLVLGIIATSIMASAAIIAAVPRATSAQHNGLYEGNINQLVNPGGSQSSGTRPGAGDSATPGAPGGGSWQPVSQDGHGRHATARAHSHPVAGTPAAAPDWQVRGTSAPSPGP